MAYGYLKLYTTLIYDYNFQLLCNIKYIRYTQYHISLINVFIFMIKIIF